MEYSFISFEKNESSLSSSLAGVSYSAILPVVSHQNLILLCNHSNSALAIYPCLSMTRLNGLTIAKHQNKITVYNCVNSVSYCHHCPIFELLANDLLYHCICRWINRCCGFIQHKNAAFLQQGSSQTEQLSLPYTPVFSIFNHCHKHIISFLFAGRFIQICCILKN